MPKPIASPQTPGQSPAGRALDRVPLVARMLFYCAFFLAVVLIVLPLGASQFDAFFPSWRALLPLWIRAAGWVIFAAALVGYLASSWHLVTRGRGAYVEFDPPKQFVSTGPFARSRNPVAGCVVLMLLGEALGLSSTGVLLLVAAAIPLAHIQVVALEEPLLRKRFGPDYDEYLKRVPRWIPRAPRGPGG